MNVIIDKRGQEWERVTKQQLWNLVLELARLRKRANVIGLFLSNPTRVDYVIINDERAMVEEIIVQELGNLKDLEKELEDNLSWAQFALDQMVTWRESTHPTHYPISMVDHYRGHTLAAKTLLERIEPRVLRAKKRLKERLRCLESDE